MEGQAKAADPTVVASLPPPPGRKSHETYIVQFPKNQVYRVPPRENALIVEQYRNPAAPKKTRGACCLCERRVLLTLGLIAVSIIAIVGITLATLYLIFDPTGPTFSVSNLVVKSGGADRNSRPQYKVSLIVNNPNERLGIQYEAGEVSLLFEGTRIAGGRFPRLDQCREESSAVVANLSGPGGLFRWVSSSGDGPVALELEMNLAVRIRTAGIETWLMTSNVFCHFMVTGLRSNTRILSQECDADFKEY
ncbi:hypothetical protein ACSQ67_004594 [Phaseolus vulgaris]